MKTHTTVVKQVVLCTLSSQRAKDPDIPLGHASILSLLNTVPSVHVDSVVINTNDTDDVVKETVRKIVDLLNNDDRIPTDIAFGVYVWNDDYIRTILSELKKVVPQARLVLGGPQISYTSSGLERIYPECDVFIRGYAESALAELVVAGENKTIAGVFYARTIDSNTTATSVLSELPSPWLSGVKLVDSQKSIRWESMRGCRFNCSFCQHKNPGNRPVCSEFDMDRIEREIDLFCQNDIEKITVVDPIFNNDNRRAIRILKRFKKNAFSGRLSLQVRAELINDEFLDALFGLNILLEFGLQTIHKKEMTAIKRHNNLQKFSSVVKKIQDQNIEYEVSLIYGLPRQTLSSFIETVQWCLQHNIKIIKAFPLLLLRGTKMYDEYKKYGIKHDKSVVAKVISSDTFTPREWRDMEEIAMLLENQNRDTLSFLTRKLKYSKDKYDVCCAGVRNCMIIPSLI